MIYCAKRVANLYNISNFVKSIPFDTVTQLYIERSWLVQNACISAHFDSITEIQSLISVCVFFFQMCLFRLNKKPGHKDVKTNGMDKKVKNKKMAKGQNEKIKTEKSGCWP